jgi:hypothetical protein
MKIKENRQFTRKGDVVVFRREIPDVELSCKDILDDISQDNKSLNDQKTALTNLEKNIEVSKKNIEIVNQNIIMIEENLSKIKKFEDWAKEAQISKLKSIIEEIKDDIQKKVKESYIYDDALTAEQNKIQMFHQYREYISRSEKIAENISSSVYKEYLIKKDFIKNPF